MRKLNFRNNVLKNYLLRRVRAEPAAKRILVQFTESFTHVHKTPIPSTDQDKMKSSKADKTCQSAVADEPARRQVENHVINWLSTAALTAIISFPANGDPVYYSDRPPLSKLRRHCDDLRAVAKFSQSRTSDKVPEVLLF